jgi:CRP-like cAMP-binding protein
MRISPLIRKLEQFTSLTENDRRSLEGAAGEQVDYAPKQDVICQGDRPDHVHLLLEGWACRYKILHNGNRQIMAYLIPGDLCDVHVTLLDAMDHSIGALSACKILMFPKADLADLMLENPQILRALWWSTLVDEAILREWLVNVGGRPSEKRLGHLICEMIHRARAVGLTVDDTFEMPLTQEELADTMGMSAVHMNRCFHTLRTEGLIFTDARRIFIHDLERLMAFSGFDPSYLHQVRGVTAQTGLTPLGNVRNVQY